MHQPVSPVVARRALASLVSLSRGALLSTLPDLVRDVWIAQTLRAGGDVRVLGCYATTNRAKQEWPCCVVQVQRPSLGVGHPERSALVAVYFSEGMKLCAQPIKELPGRFLGSKGGRPGVLNGDDADEQASPSSAAPSDPVSASEPAPASTETPSRRPKPVRRPGFAPTSARRAR